MSGLWGTRRISPDSYPYHLLAACDYLLFLAGSNCDFRCLTLREIEKIDAVYRLYVDGVVGDMIPMGDDIEDLAGKLIAEQQSRVSCETCSAVKYCDRTGKETCYPVAPGYVYILQSDTDWYKIGCSINPRSRYETFSVKLPFHVVYDIVISSNNYKGLESWLHQRFAHLRGDGEWFRLSPSDLRWIRNAYQRAIVRIGGTDK